MSLVSYAEVISYYARGGAEAAAVDEMLWALSVELVPVDRDLAAAAGMLRPVTAEAGLSLGNCFRLAFAAQDGLTVLMASCAWKDVAAACGVKSRFARASDPTGF